MTFEAIPITRRLRLIAGDNLDDLLAHSDEVSSWELVDGIPLWRELRHIRDVERLFMEGKKLPKAAINRIIKECEAGRVCRNEHCAIRASRNVTTMY